MVTPDEIRKELREGISQEVGSHFVNFVSEIQTEFVIIAQNEGIEKAKSELMADYEHLQSLIENGDSGMN